MEIDSDSILQAQRNNPTTSVHRKKDTKGYLAAESALRKIQTDRIRRESTKRISKGAPKIATKRFTPDQSLAFDEDPINEFGRGKLPWLVLGGAVVALVLSLAARFV